jgi:hypothetical protein
MALGKQNRSRLVGAAAPADEVKTSSAAQISMSLTSLSSHGYPFPSVSPDMIGTESPAL